MSFVTSNTDKALGRAFILGILVTIGVLTFQPLWFGWESRLLDWRISTLPRSEQHVPILLVAVAPDPTNPCASRGMDYGQLARAIEALHEAQAALVAPLFPEPAGNPEECRDALGETYFIHAAEQTDFVIVPDSVPPATSTHARGIGHTDVPRDADGIVRRVKLQVPRAHTSVPAIGLAIAKALDARAAQISPPFGAQPAPRIRYPARRAEHPFASASLSTLFSLSESKRWRELTSMVQGTAVLLFPAASESPMLRTPEEPAVPEAFYHAYVAYTALTDGWLWEPTPWTTALIISLFASGMAWAGLTMTWRRNVAVLIVVLGGYCLLAVWLAPLGDFILPCLTVPLGQVLGLASGLAWSALTTTHRQLAEADRCLQDLKITLAQKESTAVRLKNELFQFQNRIHESTEHIHELELAAATACSRWEAAQVEVARTRNQVQDLEREIRRLRPISPFQEAESSDPVSASYDSFISECAAFGIVTRDPSLLSEFQKAKKAAVTRHPILLLGETGTGKEVFADAIHRLSPWHAGPFVPVNMTAIRPELFESELFGHVKGAFTGAIGRKGLIESAHGGTLFLDEVGDLAPDLQAKLLRVIETGSLYRVGDSQPTTIDVRLVAATNKDLLHEVEHGRFRADLYYRLKSIVLTLPPLRERAPEDLKLLTAHFLHSLSLPGHDFTLSEGAWQAMRRHPWAGNVRELRQTLAQAMALAPNSVLTEEDLRISLGTAHVICTEPSPESPTHTPSREDWAQWEDKQVVHHLRQCRFDMKATAAALGWDRSTVTQRLKGIGFREIVAHHGNIETAATVLAGDRSLAPLVEAKLREYHGNVMKYALHARSFEEALAICRRRLKNLPDRHFPAVQALIQQAFSRKDTESVSS